MVDYFGNRKAAWYAAAAGSRPVIAASEKISKSLKWWICNDVHKQMVVDVEIKVQPVSGDLVLLKKITITVPANSSTAAYEMSTEGIQKEYGKNAIIVCDIVYENGSDRSWWSDGLPREMPLKKANLIVTRKGTKYEGEVTIHTDNWARVVTLDADVDFSDNYFEMLPGETKFIKWKSLQPFSGDIKIDCWNE